jgi:GTP-binding protein Era/rRNA maturation RNase YbeY
MINIFCTAYNKAPLRLAAEAVFQKFNIPLSSAEAEIGIVSEEEIRALNKEKRNIDAVTDVLSFPALESVRFPFDPKEHAADVNPETGCVILGEVYICGKRAEEQAEEYGHSLSRELGFLTAHGLLHLLGFDHVVPEEAEKMERLQEEILAAAGLPRDAEEDALPQEFDGVSEEEPNTEAGEGKEETDFYSGFIAILGRPNAGKSTLINALVGEKVSIVSWKPQTTRNKILGIRNDKNCQLIFVDTPGLHKPKNALGEFMMHSVTSALESVDAVLYVVDGEKGLSAEDKANVERYVKEAGKKVVIALNKIDHITRERVMEILTDISRIEGMAAVVPVSALREKNLVPLVEELKKLMHKGPKLFSDEMYTDRSVRFLTSEIIREKAFRLLDKEIPYGVGVIINKFEEKKNHVTEIDATIILQKAAHKPIVLGKNGEMIKKISTYSREDIEKLLGGKVFLTLWVKVKEDWRDDPAMLNEIGYTKQDYQ